MYIYFLFDHYQKCWTFRACITILSRDRESGSGKEILAGEAISYNLDVNLYLPYSQKGSETFWAIVTVCAFAY